MHPKVLSKAELKDVASMLALKIWTDLKESNNLYIHINEESITDYFLPSLKQSAPLNVEIRKFHKFEEGKTTGADWEWWFIGKHRAFGMRVQAKRINCRTKRYDRILYRVKGSKQLQINLLITDAARAHPPLFPVYCFYNYFHPTPSSISSICSGTPPWNMFGCTITNAKLVKKIATSSSISFESILSESLPLMCLFCPSTSGDFAEGVRNSVKKTSNVKRFNCSQHDSTR